MLEITSKFITKCDSLFLQSVTAFFLQSASSVITKCETILLQSGRRLLQSTTEQGVLGLTYARYVPQASLSPYTIIVYVLANYRPRLSHFLANVIFAIPTKSLSIYVSTLLIL